MSFPIFLLCKLYIYQIIQRITAGTGKIQSKENNEINQSKLALWHHGIMHIEESHGHGDDHWDKAYADHETKNQKEGAAELRENGKHESHIASKTKYAWESIGQLIEIGQFVKSMHKEENTEKQSDKEKQNGDHFLPAVMRKEKIIQHGF